MKNHKQTNQSKSPMLCTNCVLPGTFPGIRFDADGVCNHCRRYIKSKGKIDADKIRYKEKFLNLLNQLNEPTKLDNRPYDAIMAYSGGKDSTYTLRLLKEQFDLKVLAITFDQGFISPAAQENIWKITERLDVTHLNVRPPRSTLCELFAKSTDARVYPMKSLERASSVCNSCMNIVKSLLLKTAIEMKVPLIVYGWSPGQAPVQSSVFKTNAPIIRQMQSATVRPIREMVQDKLSSFFLEKHHFQNDAERHDERFPYLVHPLAFMDYDEAQIYSSVKEMGWVDPKDTDANSTNCLLNSFANEIHMRKFGFHPYAFEIASLVRQGYMTREEGLKRLSTPADPKVIEHVKKTLGLSKNI